MLFLSNFCYEEDFTLADLIDFYALLRCLMVTVLMFVLVTYNTLFIEKLNLFGLLSPSIQMISLNFD